MEPTAPSYLTRVADSQLLDALIAGEYVYVLDSRQKGKSSLVAQTIVKLKERGVSTVKLDLQRIGANVTPEQWYAGLLAGIGQELGLSKELFAYWEARQAMGPLARWVGAIAEIVLPKTDKPTVIFVDEVDFVRALQFSTDEFFAGIRDCYNRRSEQSGFERLTFCLVGVATPGQLIRNPEITPFNIGTKIELTDFTLDEMKGYSTVLSSNGRNGDVLMRRIHYWVNGHPYLTQLLCSHVATRTEVDRPHAVDRLVRDLFLTPDARHREPNFADVERRILDPDVPGMSPDERKTQVLDLYGRLLRGKGVDASEENPVVASLQLAGVGYQVRGSLRVRNLVYKSVFDEKWRQQSMPDAELRRVRGATRLATLRTTSVASIVILAVSSGAVNILNISRERGIALTNLNRQTKDLNRVSNERKSALSSLEEKNRDLKQISSDRQTAVEALSKGNAELKSVSSDRERALTSLKLTTKDLKQVSAERERTIRDLQETSEALKMRSYSAELSTLKFSLSDQNSTRIMKSYQRVQNLKIQGWEQGYLGQILHQYEYRTNVNPGRRYESNGGQFSFFESQPSGSLGITMPEGLVEIGKNKLIPRPMVAMRPEPSEINKLNSIPSIYPTYRRGNYRFFRSGDNFTTMICDATTGKVLVPPKKGNSILDLIPQTGVFVQVPAGHDDTVEFRKIDGNQLIHSDKGPTGINQTWFQPDGTLIVVFSRGNPELAEVRYYDGNGNLKRKMPTPKFSGGANELSPDGTLLLAIDVAKYEVRRTKDLSTVCTLSPKPPTFSDAAFSPDNREIVIGCPDGTVRVFDGMTGQQKRTLYCHETGVTDVDFMPDGKRPVSLDNKDNLVVWSASTPPAMQILSKEAEDYVGMTKDCKYLVTLLNRKTLRSTNLDTGRSVSYDLDHPADDPGRAFYKDFIYVCTTQGKIIKLSASTLEVFQTVSILPDKEVTFIPLPQGKVYIVGSDWATGKSGTFNWKLFDLESMKVENSFPMPGVASFQRSPSRTLKYFAYYGQGSTKIYLHNSLTGKKIREWKFDKRIFNMTQSPDGNRMVVCVATDFGATDSELQVFDTNTGKKMGNLKLSGTVLLFMLFSPDGKILSGANRLGNGFLWDIREMNKVIELSPEHKVREYGFSPDNKRIVTSSEESELVLWDTKTGAELWTLQHPNEKSKIDWGGAGFTSDGKTIIGGCVDGVTRIWRSQPINDQPKAARK